MKPDLIQLYKSILRYSGIDADSDGYISAIVDDRREPTLLGGARMVLPLEQHLRNPNPKEKVIFHPLSENILRGESEIITKLREIINVRLNFTFAIIAQNLLSLIASPEEHKKLNPDQTELLIAVKDVDTTTVNNFVTLMVEGIKTQASKMFMNIYIKRGGSIGTKRYARVGIYSFNLYEELQKDSNEILGVKLRVKDKEAYKQLYNFILPQLATDVTAYNRGSDSQLAPFLDCLMKTSVSIASRFNDILDEFGDFIDQAERLVFDADWVETFENLGVMESEVRRIPAQAGNEGSVVTQAQEPTRPALPVAQITQPQVQHHQPAVYQPAYQQQPQQPMQPPIKQTGHGLDWRSVQAANPAMAMSGNPMAPFIQQQQMYQQSVQPAAWVTQQPNQQYYRPNMPGTNPYQFNQNYNGVAPGI